MFCKRCGQRLEATALLCAACGAPTYIYAGFWKRLFAWLLDSFIINAGFILLAAVVAAVWGFVDPDLFQTEEMAQAAIEGAEPLIALIEILMYWVYYAKFESSAKRGTPGKLALGVMVTDLEGRRVSFGRATGRHFAKFVSGVLLGAGFLMIGVTDKKQGLHDRMARCLVLNRS
ncbi:MAG TPA: RDD family protein [Burkholderiales bacterium]|nr:RDD family protein [Burkholderiales bacterium]